MFSLDGYRTIQTRAAVVQRTDRGVVSVSGRDRASWLQGLLTNDVQALAAGDRCYSAYLTPQGRMITDMYVVALTDRMLLDVPAPLAAALRDRLDSLIFAEDAHVADESARIAVWGVYGPDAPNVRRADPLGSAAGSAEGSVFASADDPSFGVPGLALYLDRSRPLPATLAALAQADLDTLEVVRIEAGTPRFLADMFEDTIPLEAGIENRAISFTKGCYVGQEVIVRVTTRGGGRVAKKLVRLRVQGSGIGDRGSARIFSGEREIGRITSSAFSPSENATVALGYVRRDFAASGTEVTLVWDDGPVKAVVQ